jgi:hypothetical protein
MTRLFISTLIVFFSNLIFAMPVPEVPSGSYQFKGHFESATTKTTEVIKTIDTSGKLRLKFLMENGWSCQYRSNNLYQCHIFSMSSIIPKEIIRDLKQKYFNFKLDFGTPTYFELLTHTEFLIEYSVSQNVFYDSQKALNYNLRLTQDGFKKIQIPFENNQLLYLNLKMYNLLTIAEKMTIENENVLTTYYIQLKLEQD